MSSSARKKIVFKRKKDIPTLPFDDDYQKLLEDPLDDFFSSFVKEGKVVKSYDFYKEKFDILKYVETAKSRKLVSIPFMRVILSLSDDKKKINISVDQEVIDEYKKFNDSRVDILIEFFYETLEWVLSVKKDIFSFIPKKSFPFSMYFWISDRSPWVPLNEKYPVFMVAKPKQLLFPLFPDSSFLQSFFDGRYSGPSYNWDQVKEIIFKPVYPKVPQVYFRGNDTTRRKSNIRGLLSQKSKEGYFFDSFPKGGKRTQLKVFVGPSHVPLYEEGANKKFLLDLPGNYPWSNRLKNLFLMEGSIIRVNELWEHYAGEWKDEETWEQFFDYVLKPFKGRIHTVESQYINYPYEKKEEEKKANRGEVERVLKQINEIVVDVNRNPEREEKLINEIKTHVMKLSLERIYQYIFKCMIWCSKI